MDRAGELPPVNGHFRSQSMQELPPYQPEEMQNEVNNQYYKMQAPAELPPVQPPARKIGPNLPPIMNPPGLG